MLGGRLDSHVSAHPLPPPLALPFLPRSGTQEPAGIIVVAALLAALLAAADRHRIGTVTFFLNPGGGHLDKETMLQNFKDTSSPM